MANEQEKQTRSELAEQHHCLDCMVWDYKTFYNFKDNGGHSRMEEDQPQCSQRSRKTEDKSTQDMRLKLNSVLSASWRGRIQFSLDEKTVYEMT